MFVIVDTENQQAFGPYMRRVQAQEVLDAILSNEAGPDPWHRGSADETVSIWDLAYASPKDF